VAKSKPTAHRGGGAEATGVGVGTFIVGISRFFPTHPTLQSFLVFVAPFTAVLINTYLRRAFEKFKRSRDFNLLIRGIDEQIADPQTSPARKQRLRDVREKLYEARLKEQIEQAELVI
jgi:hypothetical protein